VGLIAVNVAFGFFAFGGSSTIHLATQSAQNLQSLYSLLGMALSVFIVSATEVSPGDDQDG